MGEITFDKNGDTSQKTVSVYAVDPAGANGKGAWVPKKEITFE
jgi:ABC-type branched-subunit amino acid transport system substrate-binding protein